MLVDDLLGDAGAKRVANATVMLVSEDEQICVKVPGPLQDDTGNIVLRRAHYLPVRLNAQGGELIDEGLDSVAVGDLDVVFGRTHAEPCAAGNVTRDDVAARNMQHVQRATCQQAYLLGPLQRRYVFLSGRGIDRQENPLVHGLIS